MALSVGNGLRMLRAPFALFGATLLGACLGSEPGEAAVDFPGVELARQARGADSADGTIVEGVKANGDGCPPGSWLAEVSDDGRAFTVIFSGYEASVSPGISANERECKIDVRLKTNRKSSFSVVSVYYSGVVFLDREGMKAEQTARYGFKGPVEVESNGRTEFVGPADTDYVFEDDVRTRPRIASKCGMDGVLHVKSRLRIENDLARTGSGYLNTLATDGAVRLSVRLESKACD